MSSATKDVIKQVYAAVSRGDSEGLSALMADDLVEHEEVPGLEPNKEGVLQFFRALRGAFPDLTMTADAMIAEGDLVSMRGTMSGTHRGEFMGVPASGNEIHVPIADFFRVHDGRIVEHWGVTDTGAMMEQMGGPPGV